DEVDEDAHPEPVRPSHELVGLRQGAEVGVDVAVVTDVVPAVGERRGIPRADPDGVDTQSGQVREAIEDPANVSGAVAVVVGERAGVDLVDDGAAPPLGARWGSHGINPFTGPPVSLSPPSSSKVFT